MHGLHRLGECWPRPPVLDNNGGVDPLNLSGWHILQEQQQHAQQEHAQEQRPPKTKKAWKKRKQKRNRKERKRIEAAQRLGVPQACSSSAAMSCGASPTCLSPLSHTVLRKVPLLHCLQGMHAERLAKGASLGAAGAARGGAA